MYAVLRRGELMALHWEDRYGQLTLGDKGEPPALLTPYQRERTLRRGLPNSGQ